MGAVDAVGSRLVSGVASLGGGSRGGIEAREATARGVTVRDV